jgi:hypothetical protein
MVSLPLTRLPDAEASTATACCAVLAAGATGAADDSGGVLLQPARTTSEPARASGAIAAMRMVEISGDGPVLRIRRAPVQGG